MNTPIAGGTKTGARPRGCEHHIETGIVRGGRSDQAKRLKELENENAQLKKLVANQALDLAILKETVSGNY